MSSEQRTRDYICRRTAEGKPELVRCLKRYITSEIHKVLSAPVESPLVSLANP